MRQNFNLTRYLNTLIVLVVVFVAFQFLMARPAFASTPDLVGVIGSTVGVFDFCTWVEMQDSAGNTRYTQQSGSACPQIAPVDINVPGLPFVAQGSVMPIGMYIFQDWGSLTQAERNRQKSSMIDSNLDGVLDVNEASTSNPNAFSVSQNPFTITAILGPWIGGWLNSPQIIAVSSLVSQQRIGDILYVEPAPGPTVVNPPTPICFPASGDPNDVCDWGWYGPNQGDVSIQNGGPAASEPQDHQYSFLNLRSSWSGNMTGGPTSSSGQINSLTNLTSLINASAPNQGDVYVWDATSSINSGATTSSAFTPQWHFRFDSFIKYPTALVKSCTALTSAQLEITIDDIDSSGRLGSGIKQVLISIDSGPLIDITANRVVGTFTYTYPMSGFVPGSIHTIQMQAIDNANNNSGLSSATSFTVPAACGPIDTTPPITNISNLTSNCYSPNAADPQLPPYIEVFATDAGSGVNTVYVEVNGVEHTATLAGGGYYRASWLLWGPFPPAGGNYQVNSRGVDNAGNVGVYSALSQWQFKYSPILCTGPWIKTTGGDVHSNSQVNTPGGPP